MWIDEGLKTGYEFREDGGRQVGGVVVVAEQDDLASSIGMSAEATRTRALI